MAALDIPITVAQAKELTGRIKRSAEATWKLLEEAHARKAWEPLGYRSFKAYAQAEFGMSENNAYRLLTQAVVTKALNAAAGTSPTPARGGPTARQSERIKPKLPEATAEVTQRVEAGEAPERVVPEVIQTYGAPPKIEGAVRPSPAPSSEVEESDDRGALRPGSGPSVGSVDRRIASASDSSTAAVAGPAPSSPPTFQPSIFTVPLAIEFLLETPDDEVFRMVADPQLLRMLAAWCQRNLAARGFEDPHERCRQHLAHLQQLLDEAKDGGMTWDQPSPEVAEAQASHFAEAQPRYRCACGWSSVGYSWPANAHAFHRRTCQATWSKR